VEREPEYYSYFNSAASTPRSVFGKLFSLSNYHLKKLMRDKPGLGKKLGDLESDLAARLTTPPPARFTQEETICFYLGYYHQCNGKKEEKENV
jgi:CRISPR-associated protein Csd1